MEVDLKKSASSELTFEKGAKRQEDRKKNLTGVLISVYHNAEEN